MKIWTSLQDEGESRLETCAEAATARRGVDRKVLASMMMVLRIDVDGNSALRCLMNIYIIFVVRAAARSQTVVTACQSVKV